MRENVFAKIQLISERAAFGAKLFLVGYRRA
jgi:hypothetical protein